MIKNEELNVIECTNCEWCGSEDKLIKEYNNFEMTYLDLCPSCNDACGLLETGFTISRY